MKRGDSWYYSSDDDLGNTRDDSRRQCGGSVQSSLRDFQEELLVENWEVYKARYEEELKSQTCPEHVLKQYCSEQCCSSRFAKEVFEEYKKFHILLALAHKET